MRAAIRLALVRGNDWRGECSESEWAGSPPRPPRAPRRRAPRPRPSQSGLLRGTLGKTVLGLLCVVEGHGRRDGGHRGALEGRRIWWSAPSYPIASAIWGDLKHALRKAGIDNSETDRPIMFPGGGAVTVPCADNLDSLRGFRHDGIPMDEAAFAPRPGSPHCPRSSRASPVGHACGRISDPRCSGAIDFADFMVSWASAISFSTSQ